MSEDRIEELKKKVESWPALDIPPMSLLEERVARLERRMEELQASITAVAKGPWGQ